MARYNPPTRVTAVSIPFVALVTQIDPSWNRWKHWEVQYEFTRRRFFADPYHTGPYNKTNFDNPVIPVGPYIVNP
jgi:hypothetical protein